MKCSFFTLEIMLNFAFHSCFFLACKIAYPNTSISNNLLSQQYITRNVLTNPTKSTYLNANEYYAYQQSLTSNSLERVLYSKNINADLPNNVIYKTEHDIANSDCLKPTKNNKNFASSAISIIEIDSSSCYFSSMIATFLDTNINFIPKQCKLLDIHSVSFIEPEINLKF